MTDEMTCTMCGRPRSRVAQLVARDDGQTAICDRCVREARELRPFERLDGDATSAQIRTVSGDAGIGPEVCAFCDKSRRQVKFLIGHGQAYICDECLAASERLRGDAPPLQPTAVTKAPSSPFRFERYTEAARQTIFTAQREARDLGHGEIGTGHILLGILCAPVGLGLPVLTELGVDSDRVRRGVADRPMPPAPPQHGTLPFGGTCERLLIAVPASANDHGQDYVGTEHLLLAMVGDVGSDASRILAQSGVGRADVEATLARLRAAG